MHATLSAVFTFSHKTQTHIRGSPMAKCSESACAHARIHSVGFVERAPILSGKATKKWVGTQRKSIVLPQLARLVKKMVNAWKVYGGPQILRKLAINCLILQSRALKPGT